MCGILTAVSLPNQTLDQRACRRALSRLSWRGPDLCVPTAWGERVFLGQTVLSLTGEAAAHPASYVWSRCGRYAIAFNGEIYNYRTLAQRWLGTVLPLSEATTDTEVLVNLHTVKAAADIPELLDGMFAYAVLDTEAGHIYVARDVQGEKSLFTAASHGVTVVASEIGALRSLLGRLEPDAQVMRDYFRTRHFMPFSGTAFKDVRHVEPGALERLDIDTGQWSVVAQRRLRDWIDPAVHERNLTRSIDDLADELDALLTTAANQMIPTARPWAAVVSGGVDSSLLAAYLLAVAEPDLLVAVDHVGKDEISSDLSGFEQVLGQPIDVLRVGAASYAGEVVRCQQVCAGPLGAHSFVPQSLQSAFVRARGARVLFGGEGGDELFGGYDAYLRLSSQSGPYSPSPYLTHIEPEVEFVEDAPGRVQQQLASAWTESLDAYAHVEDMAERRLLAACYGDAAFQLPAVGLRGGDLMSMMWSVETRCMLMRRDVVAFALNLPGRARIDAATPTDTLRTKVLLKRLFLRRYPADLLVKKQGFAGFPNEAASYLGDPADYLAFDVLGIRPLSQGTSLSRATLWKLANVEYFLRVGSA